MPIIGIQDGVNQILLKQEVEDKVKEYYGNLLSGRDLGSSLPCEWIRQCIHKENPRDPNVKIQPLDFTSEEVMKAMSQCNFDKAIGTDGFDGKILQKNKEVKQKVASDLAKILSVGEFPSYFQEGRLVLLSKKSAKNIAPVEETRPIVVNSHLYKICEKTILNKLDSFNGSRILQTGSY